MRCTKAGICRLLQLCGVKSYGEIFGTGRGGCCWHSPIPHSQPHKFWLTATAAGGWCEAFAERWPTPDAPEFLPVADPPDDFQNDTPDAAVLDRAFTLIGRDNPAESVMSFCYGDAEMFRREYETLIVTTAKQLFVAGEITLLP